MSLSNEQFWQGKDDLSDGIHKVVVSHKAGHLSGDDNIKGDGNAYYDNDAMFDCLIIKLVSDPEPTTEPTEESSSETSEEATQAPVNPGTGEDFRTINYVIIISLCAIIIALITIKVTSKKEDHN